MASRYVPPHRRRPSNVAAADDVGDSHNEDSADDSKPRKLADLELSDSDRGPLHTLREIGQYYGSSTRNSNLHNSTEKPRTLAYIVIFRVANPQWQADKTILAHTNLLLLPGYTEFGKNSERPPINIRKYGYTSFRLSGNDDKAGHAAKSMKVADAVRPTQPNNRVDCVPIFMELGMSMGYQRRFIFHGFFTISNIEFLGSHSPELVRMLQERWEPMSNNPNRPPYKPRERDEIAWHKSVSQDWAIIKMKPVSEEDRPQEPCIQVLPDEAHRNQGRDERKEEELIEGVLAPWLLREYGYEI